jgi:PAS domain S-box-containing protein
MDAEIAPGGPGFLAGGGEMGALMRAHDWAATPVGPPETWPTALKTTVRLMLTSQHPMFIWWGAELTSFYNDAYSVLIGPDRHPAALGRPGREVWAEVWDVAGPQIEFVMAGHGATWHERQLIPITRGDTREDVWWTYGFSPIDDEAAPAGIGGVLMVSRDVTAEVNAEAALRDLAASLEEQVEARTRERDRLWVVSQDISVVIDPQGIFQAINPATTRVLGWSSAEMVGKTVFDFILAEDVPATSGALAHAMHDVLPSHVSRYRHREGGFRWLSWVAAPDDGRIYATARDISAEKAAAAELAAAQDALRQSQKMEAVGQLTGGLAHDFNNLLTGITGSLELLQTRIAQGRIKEVDRYIDAAQGAATRAAALTHRLLAFSRRQTLDPKPTQANRLVAGMAELIRRTVGPAILVETVLAAGLWPTLCDPNQLENALLNLCINARDAMAQPSPGGSTREAGARPDGGRLTIETANVWLDERGARERDMVPGQYVAICVTDTGSGMTPDVAARAFDPFFTTKPIGLGTGLGLSMIYGFARQSGGQVRIYSEVGEGTTMRLYLPRHGDAAEGEQVQAGLIAAPRAGQGETVLVVDDEPTVRMLVAEVLEEFGYTAIEAVDGAAGLRVLQSNARVDLLVTDVGLPGGMNGRQVADAGRAVRPGLKVLFITGYAENAVLGHGHLDPGMHVLTKPFAMEVLASRIKDLIAGP